jgi:hypothetical protein
MGSSLGFTTDNSPHSRRLARFSILRRFRLPLEHRQYSLGSRKHCDNDYFRDPFAQSEIVSARPSVFEVNGDSAPFPQLAKKITATKENDDECLYYARVCARMLVNLMAY